ncbi:hypothetical protein [Bradyrhizobium sp. SZCCHNS3051]|uniref:hypothetical protein n=1 Tax=Bradyrhizobium sp. SZCCHNS3051 TaxID=3057320 RepID=UPI002916FBAA|nr:hypothetical protein [Bradyrhizobium sp. SZCCHNS3051]
MRTFAFMIVLLASVSLNPLFAQGQGKPSPNPAETKASSGVPAREKGQSTSERQKQHTLHRMGPGIDWDHRKAGRDWKISPQRKKNDAHSKRDGAS